jgi:hypothetical protein
MFDPLLPQSQNGIDVHRITARVLGLTLFVVLLASAACNVPTNQGSQNDATAVPSTLTSLPETSEPLPDLVIGGTRFDTTPAGCTTDDTRLIYSLVIRNNGQGDAGPFEVEINGERHTVSEGVAAESDVSITPIDSSQYELSVVIDPDNTIQESDESNNIDEHIGVYLPTLPPNCTQTPTP